MDERMTIEQVRDKLRSLKFTVSNCVAMADAIDAHLTQPAQAVDVGVIREVAAQLGYSFGLGISKVSCQELADKLTRAIGNPSTTK